MALSKFLEDGMKAWHAVADDDDFILQVTFPMRTEHFRDTKANCVAALEAWKAHRMADSDEPLLFIFTGGAVDISRALGICTGPPAPSVPNPREQEDKLRVAYLTSLAEIAEKERRRQEEGDEWKEGNDYSDR